MKEIPYQGLEYYYQFRLGRKVNVERMQATPNETIQQSNALSEFQAGLTAALRSWSALRTAVDSGWGGIESQMKAEDLRKNILACFDGTQSKPKISLEELEDNLSLYMEEEFSVVLDDDSEKQLAMLIFQMYETCSVGNFTLTKQVIENARIVSEAYTPKNNVISSEGEMDDASDEETEGTMDMSMNNTTFNAQEYASQHLFGVPKQIQNNTNNNVRPARQLGESAPEKPQEVMDEDGFAPVVSKRKGRR